MFFGLMAASELAHLDEHELIRRAQSGDAIAVSELDGRYREQLIGFARKSVENHADADDLAQSTLAKAFASLDQFQAGTNFRSWLFRIARNAIVDWVRAADRYHSTLAARRQAVEQDNNHVWHPAGELAHHAFKEDPGNEETGSHATEFGESETDETGIFAYARQVLKPHEYQALWLKYVDQQADEAIARRLHRSPGAVRVLLTRIRKRLASFRPQDP